jgi:large subunit ribosomal protein L29
MTAMKHSDLLKETDDQLAATLADMEKHLFQLRFQSATDRLETPSEIRKARRDIARIRTLQRQRELTALGKTPDATLTATRDAAALGTTPAGKPFMGKRKALRTIQRIDGILAVRAAKKGIK